MDWPVELIDAIARRRSVIVIGAGVSKHSLAADGVTRPPVWKEFLQMAFDSLPNKQDNDNYIKEAIDNGDFLHACECLKRRFDEDWKRLLRKIFLTPRFKPSSIHDLIIGLDSRIVFSLNFDEIYERAFHAMDENALIIKNFFDRDACEFLRGDGRYVVKVHGNISNADKLIFTQKEYAQARVENSAFYNGFDAALLTHTFLFIGAGVNDPDMALLLENQAFSFPSGMPHYMVTSNPIREDLALSLRENRNIKMISYDKIDDGHSGLVDELRDLKEKVEARREQLAADITW